MSPRRRKRQGLFHTVLTLAMTGVVIGQQPAPLTPALAIAVDGSRPSA